MGTTLLERQTVILADDFYAACLYGGGGVCMVRAGGRMLCTKHERLGRSEGWLWQFPGDYMDDYTSEGEDVLNEICDWLIAYDMDTVLELVNGLGDSERGDLLVKFDENRKRTTGRLRQVGFGGFGEITACVYCNTNQPTRRGLCRKCYEIELVADRLYRYPTSRYLSNVKGHAHWMLKYQPERLRAIASGYGVVIEKSPQP